MRALVTGSTGFIGRRLCAILTEQGWPPVVAKRGDDIDGIMRATLPDVVFHLAGAYVRDHEATDVANLVQSNVEYGGHLLESMRTNGITRIVVASSLWTLPAPRNLYAATKLAFDQILNYYCDTGVIVATNLLLGDTYGPEDRRGKIVSRMFDAIVRDEELPMTPGDQIIDIVHVNDVCSAFLQCALYDGGWGQWALRGERVSLRTLAGMIEQATGKLLRARWGALPYPLHQVMRPVEFPSLPGWAPMIPLRQGLAQLTADNA